MKRNLISTGVLVLLLVATAAAQSPYRDMNTPTTRDMIAVPSFGGSTLGLLDPLRITMQNQMGMSYMSLGGRGYSQGYYMTSLTYRFDAPLLMRVRLGVANNPFAVSSGAAPGSGTVENLFQNAEFFGGADIDWRPRDNVFVRFSFDKLAPGAYYGNPYMNRWGMFGSDSWNGSNYGGPLPNHP